MHMYTHAKTYPIFDIHRLSYGASGGCVLNDKGLVRKKWVWSDESAFVQPMALNINSHILIRIVSQVRQYRLYQEGLYSMYLTSSGNL